MLAKALKLGKNNAKQGDNMLNSVERLKDPNNAVKNFRKFAGAGAAAAASVLLFADSYLDIAGDKHRVRSEAEIERLTDERAQRLYDSASIAGRYSMLFLQHLDGESGVIVGELEGGKGLLRYLSAPFASEDGGDYEEQRDYGQDCLGGTAFDITASEVRGGDVSAVASLSVGEEGIISIHPAGTEARPLRLTQDVQNMLVPADEATRLTMEAYGCSAAEL